jgi:hypothetical protein
MSAAVLANFYWKNIPTGDSLELPMKKELGSIYQ